jgi:hypothetical protein
VPWLSTCWHLRLIHSSLMILKTETFCPPPLGWSTIQYTWWWMSVEIKSCCQIKTVPSTTVYLATPSKQAQMGQWEFFTSLQFNTSSANFVHIYLTADQSNLMAANLNGYFVRIGGTTDEVSLFKKVNGIATKIIDGVDGITNTYVNNLKIKVTRTAGGDWKLERDATGLGAIYVQEGVINDVTLNKSSYFGVAVTQSTASFILKDFFDDFYVLPIWSFCRSIWRHNW